MAGEQTLVTKPQGGTYMRIKDNGSLRFGDGDDIILSWNGTVFLITGLPTADPTVAGALWSNAGVVTVSAG